MADEAGYLETRDARVWERLMRAQDLKGDIPQLLAAMLQPTAQLEDYSQAEYAWLRRTRRHTAAVSVAAVAAQYPVIQFRNSGAGGSTIIRTRLLSVANPNAGAIQVGIGVLKNSVVVYGSLTFPMLDDRQPPTTAPASGNIGTATVAAALTELNDLFRVRLRPDETILLDIPAVLTTTGAGQLTFHGLNQNTALMAAVTYDERDILSSEAS